MENHWLFLGILLFMFNSAEINLCLPQQILLHVLKT